MTGSSRCGVDHRGGLGMAHMFCHPYPALDRDKGVAMTRGIVGLLVCALAPLLTVVVSTDAAAARPTCDSKTYRKPDGTKYVCTFAEEFSGKKLDRSKWMAQRTEYTGHTHGGDCWVDSPNNIKVSNGTLKLITREESRSFRCVKPRSSFETKYTSASVSTYGKFKQTYGRFSIRAKFPSAKVAGSQSALWLYPFKQTYGGWPTSGEIDIAEFYSRRPDRVFPAIHYHPFITNRSPTKNNRCFAVKKAGSTFHTYTLEWNPGVIKISYDGITCLEHTIQSALPGRSAPFNKPFVLYLTQVLGTKNNPVKPGVTPLPLTTEIDWVHIWR